MRRRKVRRDPAQKWLYRRITLLRIGIAIELTVIIGGLLSVPGMIIWALLN